MNNVTTPPTKIGRLRALMKENWQRVRRSIRNYFILVFVLGLLFFGAFFRRIVNFVGPGEAGVIWQPLYGGTQIDKLYKEGLQLLWPWDKLYIYSLRVQQIPHEFDALSKNGLPIHFEISIRYQPIKESLPTLHQQIGPDYVERVVKPEVQAHVRKIVANYLPEEIYTSEGYLLEVIRQGAMAVLNERNISLDNLLIKRMTLPEPIRAAIERKLAAEQLSLQYDYVLIKETKEAERKRIEAAGIRDFQRVAGEGGMFNQYLNFYGIEATLELAKSSNSKTLLIGSRENGLPLLFNLPSADSAPGTPLPKATNANDLLTKETKELIEKTRLPETRTKVEVQDGSR
jgi:regulator of protease activity HflC (stomatin/prohibitin superfamily)